MLFTACLTNVQEQAAALIKANAKMAQNAPNCKDTQVGQL